MTATAKEFQKVVQHIWLKGKTAEVSVQPSELEILKQLKKGVIVCNRFSAKYEDIIVSNIISRVNENYRLITTHEPRLEFLNDGKILCVKKSSLDTWAERKLAIIEAINTASASGETVVVFPSRRL